MNLNLNQEYHQLCSIARNTKACFAGLCSVESGEKGKSYFLAKPIMFCMPLVFIFDFVFYIFNSWIYIFYYVDECFLSGVLYSNFLPTAIMSRVQLSTAQHWLENVSSQLKMFHTLINLKEYKHIKLCFLAFRKATVWFMSKTPLGPDCS